MDEERYVTLLTKLIGETRHLQNRPPDLVPQGTPSLPTLIFVHIIILKFCAILEMKRRKERGEEESDYLDPLSRAHCSPERRKRPCACWLRIKAIFFSRLLFCRLSPPFAVSPLSLFSIFLLGFLIPSLDSLRPLTHTTCRVSCGCSCGGGVGALYDGCRRPTHCGACRARAGQSEPYRHLQGTPATYAISGSCEATYGTARARETSMCRLWEVTLTSCPPTPRSGRAVLSLPFPGIWLTHHLISILFLACTTYLSFQTRSRWCARGAACTDAAPRTAWATSP